jgi:hypothetical protein
LKVKAPSSGEDDFILATLAEELSLAGKYQHFTSITQIEKGHGSRTGRY